MKTIPITFVENNNGTGPATFTRVNHDAKTNVFIYKRTFDEPNYSVYEVFIAKIVKEGAPLPNGKFVTEAYIQYPGATHFGHSAFSINNLERATTKFNELIEKVNKSDEINIDVVDTETLTTKILSKGKRGRKSARRPDLIYPTTKVFTMNDLVVINKAWTRSNLYIAVKTSKTIKIVGTQPTKTGFGKATTLYSLI